MKHPPTFSELPLGNTSSTKRLRGAYDGHVWTRNKASLIAEYLHRFIQVTKGGCYIDLFSGPQKKESSETTWAAKLALERCPSDRLRRAYLFELNRNSLDRLYQLKKIHDRGWYRLSTRKVEVIEGDSNVTASEFFTRHGFKHKLPSFCLIDQRTRECDWETVRYIAQLKRKGCKVEIFYFLAQAWMDRHWGILKPKNQARIRAWWGRDDWQRFRDAGNTFDRASLMEDRFINELGYKYAQAFPILKYGTTGRVMFSMIHASDDPRALPLMGQSYKSIGLERPIPIAAPTQEEFTKELFS